MTAPFDPGLQVERTALAWTRTALSLALAGAVVTRMTVDRLGAIALLLGLATMIAAVAIGLLAGARFRRSAASLHERGAATTDGRMLVWAALSVICVGVASGLFVVWGMLGS